MDIVNYQAVQKIAKDTIEYIKTELSHGMSLKEVRRLCEVMFPDFCCSRETTPRQSYCL